MQDHTDPAWPDILLRDLMIRFFVNRGDFHDFWTLS
jgi:hypothetical protein